MSGAATPLGNMVIKLGLDDTDFGKGVQNSKKQVSYLAKEMQANLKIANLAGNQLSALGTKYQGLTNIIGAQEKQVTSLKKAYDESFVDGKATDSTKRLATQLQEANGKLASYRQQLIQTAGAYAELQVKTTGATGAIYSASEKMVSAGKGMQTVGSAMTKGVTLPIAAAATAVTTAAISWESAFAGVKKTNDEVVDSTGKVVYSYSDLEQGLRNLATQLPSTHAEIAAVAEAGGQLGIATEDIVSFTKTMIDLGESTNLSAEDAATAIAKIANITGLSADQFTNYGSSLVALGNNFATTESDVLNMANRLASAGTIAGLTNQEILGLAAAMSSVGIEAEAGGTAMTQTLGAMETAVANGSIAFDDLSSRAANAGISLDSISAAIQEGGSNLDSIAGALGLTSAELKKMYTQANDSADSLQQFADIAGMSAEQFSQTWKEQPIEAIQAFIKGLDGLADKGESATLVLDDMGLSGVRQSNMLKSLALASDTLTSAVEMSSTAWDENTALTKEASTRYETTESKLKMLKNEFVDAAIDIGGPFVDAMRDALEAGKPLIENLGNLAKKFSEADPKTQQMILKLIAFAAAAGPVLSLTGKMSSGIGGLGKSFVELSASMAKKKAITELTKELAGGAISVDTLSTALGGGATKFGLFGSAAANASGASGLGAMATTLGPLGPAILAIVGVGGALAVGYGAWKLFGEEAWNSSQRVKEWGTDVGAVTAETLGTVKSNTEQAAGQFGLMAQGVSNDTPGMVDNITTIGATIESSLTKKLEGLNGLLEELPSNFSKAAQEMLEDEITKTENALTIVQENQDKIDEIRKTASDNNREVSIAEAKMIQSLAKETTQAYVETLDLSQKEKKQILEAMNADVTNASEEQAKTWLQSLGKQRQAAAENNNAMREDMKKNLQDMGYDLDGEFATKFMESWDKINQTTVDGFDSQMAIILEKYPELANEVWLANGQLINASDSSAQAMIASNQKIIDNAKNMSDELAANAEKNAETLNWTADEATNAGSIWNNLVFDEKTGEVKTNAREAVIEATKDTNTWNQMRLVVHDANLNSNAKKIIGEAAIANNWWDGMAYEDKTAILQDEFSITMYDALKASGNWDEMSLEAKTAFMYSNTPETMAEVLLNFGLWEEMNPEIKELGADNYEFLQVLSESQEKLIQWQSIPAETKELLVDNSDLLTKIYTSEVLYSSWNAMSDSEKKLIADNEDLMIKVFASEDSLNRWNQMPSEVKQVIANNDDLMDKLFVSKDAWEKWNTLPDSEKKMLANNEDLSTKVFDSTESWNVWSNLPENVKMMLANNEDLRTKVAEGNLDLETYNGLIPALKTLTGDNYDVINSIEEADVKLSMYDSNNPLLKNLLGDSSSVINAADTGEQALSLYDSNNPLFKNLQGDSSSAIKAADTGGSALSRYDVNNPLFKNLQGDSSVVKNAASTAEGSLNRYANNNPASKNLRGVDNVSGPASDATGAITNFQNKPSVITKTLSVVASFGSSVAKILGLEKGTTFHAGGPAIVNDQRGANYRELIVPKGGIPFIPEGRDVFLPDLPKGSKVYTASQTRRLVPRYAGGVGVPIDSTRVDDLKEFSSNTPVNQRSLNVNLDNEDIVNKLDELTRIMSSFSRDLRSIQLVADGKVMADVVTEKQTLRNTMLQKIRG
ncbi:phage tail tape measure protein [Enterococcus sp. LJL90]